MCPPMTASGGLTPDILARALAGIDPDHLETLLAQEPAAIDADWRIPDALWEQIAPLLPVPPPRP